MTYIETQNEVVKKYRIVLCDGTCNGEKCPHAWRRMHSCAMYRKIYKFKFANSIRATFDLFHEIGHQETTKRGMRRAEKEYYATVWAMEECKKYGIEVPKEIIKAYQDYIDMEVDRGKRRGGQGYGKMQLVKEW